MHDTLTHSKKDLTKNIVNNPPEYNKIKVSIYNQQIYISFLISDQ